MVKTLNELKKLKQVNVTKTLTQNTLEGQINNIKKRLACELYEGVYKKTNNINILIVNNQFVCTCKEFFNYTLSKIEKLEDINYSSFTSEYIEAINRYLLTIKDFEFHFPMLEIKNIISQGVLTFRSKDYVFTDNQTNNNIYGESIKKDNLIFNNDNDIIGLKFTNYYQDEIIYMFK